MHPPSEINRRLPGRWLWLCLPLLLALASTLAHAMPVSLSDPATGQPLGLYTRYLKEQHGRMTLDEARAALASMAATPGRAPVLSFGMGSKPVWIRLTATNPLASNQIRRLTLANSWLDEIDLYFVAADRVIASYRLGDAHPFAERPLPERFFSVDHAFAPGSTDIYIRVATPDPIVLPIHLQSIEAATAQRGMQGYSYGFLYGYLIALLAYNALLFINVRDRRYLIYAGFLSAFVLTNLAYTGHGYEWLWPASVTIQRWIIPLLMMAFGTLGLLFACYFLATIRKLPGTTAYVKRMVLTFATATGLALVFSDDQLHNLQISFVFILVFSVTMPGLGIWAVRRGLHNARYFLLASIASMIGTTTTALCVLGFIAYNEWSYRAVEMGMLVDATLLAMALGRQFRATQLEKIRAEITSTQLAETNLKLNENLRELEHLAATDRLTGLWNRRHFEVTAAAEMERARRYRHPTSILIFDIDHFKSINDTCGHQTGDDVLKQLAHVVRHDMRESDLVARWGGEEFTILMPNAKLAAAAEVAEKLRHAVESGAFPRKLKVTISIGVAEWASGFESLDTWIARADDALYQAKHLGRNRVAIAEYRHDTTTAGMNKPLLQLHWSPRYECGTSEIDVQHRQLFYGANRILRLIPALELAQQAEESRLTVLEAIDDLLADTAVHFETEERILEARNWDGLDEHRHEHRQLLAQARQLREALAETDIGSGAGKLISFVAIELIANHVLRSDRQYFPARQRASPTESDGGADDAMAAPSPA